MIKRLQKELKCCADPVKAEIYPRFFKTGKGEYGEGDKFIGVIIPHLRIVAKKYRELPFADIKLLLHSKFHEERTVSLMILTEQYRKSDNENKTKIFDFYIKNTKYINNWDLVDMSAPAIVGNYLFDKPRQILTKFAHSSDLWERRIAVISTYYFIKKNQFKDTLSISEILLSDKHDLIHKAVGWMLREVGKRGIEVEKIFIKINYHNIPRTTLRYAIEKFPENERVAYLKGKFLS